MLSKKKKGRIFCCPEAEAANVDSFLLIVVCFPSTVDDASAKMKTLLRVQIHGIVADDVENLRS